jgi:hypothetical protein
VSGVRVVQVVRLKAVIDGQQERDLRDRDDEEERGEQRYPMKAVAPALARPCRGGGSADRAAGNSCHGAPLALG